MKRNYDGKTYNTATARLVGEWRNTLDAQNSNWCHEMLFQTAEGEYFLWGCGGSLSPYKFSGTVIRGARAEITPMALQDAKGWARKRLKHAAYIKEFGKYDQVA